MPLSSKLGIRDEGVDQGRVKIIDFAGTNVSVAVAGAVATVSVAAGAGVTSVTGTAPIASSGGGDPAISLNDTTVTPAAYTLSSLTVDAKGRLTAASTGSLTGPITSTGLATVVAAQTGTGSTFVMQASPTLTTPNIGTPSAGTLTNATGLPIATGVSGLGTNVATFLATPSSANLAGALTDETGSGLAVFGTAPTITGGTHTALTSLGIRSTGTGAFDLKLANAENLTVSDKTLTIQLGDTSRTLILGASPSLTGTNTGDQTITLTGDVTGTGTGSFAATIAADAVTYAKIQNVSATDRVLGRTTAGAGDVEEIATTGSGSVVRATSPTLVTPALGTPASGVLTNVTGLPTAGLIDDAVTYAKMQNVTSARLLGRATAGAGDTEEITLGTNLSFTGTTLNATAGSGATLDAVTAAVADQAGIANADWNIRWNWAKITDGESAFTFGESAAATGGTSPAGVPLQILVDIRTLAGSTISPLAVRSGGSHVFSVSPSTAQMLFANGTATAPPITFAADPGTGIYRVSLGLGVAVTTVENLRWLAGTMQLSKGSADAVSYAVNARKSRGTVAAPTVITTGDSLGITNYSGHVGATNTYQIGVYTEALSTGTIADTATGIGGIYRIAAAAVGAEPAEIVRWQAATTTGGGWEIMDEADANPTTTELDADDAVAMYNKAGKIVFAYNLAGTINYLVGTLDGSTTLWTNSTTAP